MNVSTKSKNSSVFLIIIVCLFSLSYAILRYHIVGSVPWKDLPFFILNKGIALSAFILLTLNFSFGPMLNLGFKVPEGFLNARKDLGKTGFVLVLIHAFMSFMIFNPNFYAKFFHENGTLTLFAGLSMLGGILSLVILWIINLSFQTHLREDKVFIGVITSRKFLLTAMLFTLMHLFFMGFKGWITPQNWQGGLPPISLIGFVFFVFGYVVNLIGRK